MSDTYHFIGIGGIGMSGLARLLLSQKKSVTGSDIALSPTVESLIQAGAMIHKGHAAENVPPQAKVVYTSDVKSDNPEYQAAIKMQCALLHRSDLLAELLKGHQALAVAGTHGKTSTSALLATVLVDAQWDPSFAVGGMLPSFQSNARFGNGTYFPFEADESDRSFLKYHPFGAIVTNIDNDHLNNYEESFQLLIDSFQTFMSQVESSKHLFWCRDDPHLLQLNVLGQTYGFHPESDWKIVAYRQQGFRMFFTLEHNQHLYSEIELALAGRHNILNAAAVFGLAITLGVAEASIRHTFKTFKGVLRRCESKGTFHGTLFLDDYAHHPAEIQTTLQGIRQAIGPKRLVAVFQAHRYTRTRDCLGQYGTIFDDADELLITDIFGAGEAPIPNLSHTLIQQEIEQASSIPCHYVPRSALSHYLSQFVKPYDVVVTLGAGDITKLGSETLSLLEKQPLKHFKVGLIWDHVTIGQWEELQGQFASPYLTLSHFGIKESGHWVKGENLSEMIFSQGALSSERLEPAMLQSLLTCDLFVPIVEKKKEISLQAFFGMLGKPYVGSGPRTTLLGDEVEHLRHLVASRGIRSIIPHQLLSDITPKGDYFDFLLIPSPHLLVSPPVRSATFGIPEEISLSHASQGQEVAKRVFRVLECKSPVILRFLLDSQALFWFDRLIPLSWNHSVGGIGEETGIEALLLYALHTNRMSQRARKTANG